MIVWKQKYSIISSSTSDILMKIGGNVKLRVLHICGNFDKNTIQSVRYREFLVSARYDENVSLETEIFISSSTSDILMKIGEYIKLRLLHICGKIDKDTIEIVRYREFLDFARYHE